MPAPPPDLAIVLAQAAGTPRLTPRAKALIRAYEFANERAMRTQDTRDHVEALALSAQPKPSLNVCREHRAGASAQMLHGIGEGLRLTELN